MYAYYIIGVAPQHHLCIYVYVCIYLLPPPPQPMKLGTALNTLSARCHTNCGHTLSMSRLLALAAMWCVVFPCESFCLHMFLQRSGILEACVTSICGQRGTE